MASGRWAKNVLGSVGRRYGLGWLRPAEEEVSRPSKEEISESMTLRSPQVLLMDYNSI